MKVLVILGDGGHTAEILKLLDLLGPHYEYTYMISVEDLISENKIVWEGPVYRTPLPLGKYKTSRTLSRVIKASLAQLKILLKVRPQAILTSGANIAIPICIFGRLSGTKVIYIETGSRVYHLSSTGKVMYWIANLFFVQWEPLQEKYPKAIYAGRLL
jgi:UDP-N-acetylglucosamine:LPS N-acetylglucosamine transferase